MGVHTRKLRRALLIVVSLAGVVGCQHADVDVDVMPGIYPNLLTGTETTLEVAFFAPRGASATAHDLELAKSVQVTASTGFGPGDPVVSAASAPRLSDVDGDGKLDLVASFSIAELRGAGLLGPGTSRLSVRASLSDAVYCEGTDRLFDVGSPLVRIPATSGPDPVGTTSLLAVDHSRPGHLDAGRGLVIRVWYPASQLADEPAPYFLNDREASANVPTGLPVVLPATLYDRVHAGSQRDVRPKRAGKRPTLLLSTGYGVPLTFYSGLAQDLASHGYVVVGVEHPDGSGVVVYPDGTQSTPDPTVPLSADTVHGWARDLEFVLGWLPRAGSRTGIDPAVHDVLQMIDYARVGALGHSLGGAAAIWADLESQVIRASANLDGALWGDVLAAGPCGPTMLMLAQDHFGNDPTLDEFLAHADGPVYRVDIEGAQHGNFSDMGTLIDGLASLVPGLDPAMFGLGTIDATRALTIQSAYLRAFFASALQGKHPALLEKPSPDFPEVTLTTQ